MSWTSIRPFFRARLEDLGLQEWTDGFNFENIPSEVLDGSYHIEFGDFSGQGQNQRDLDTLVRVVVRIFRKGYGDPQAAIDEVIALKEQFLIETLDPLNRLTQAFKNVQYVSSLVRELDESNDNALVAEVSFDVQVIIC